MCDLGYDEDELVQAWIERVQRARRAHVCDCCGGAIAAGESYKRITTIADGFCSAEKECAACTAVMVKFKAAHSEWYSPAGMRDLVQECGWADWIWTDDGGRIPTAEGAAWLAEVEAMDVRKKARKKAP